MFAARNMMFSPVSSVTFNAVGGGFANTGNPSYNITVAANSYVIVFASCDRNNALTSITVGGVTPTLLATVAHNGVSSNGYLNAYGLAVATSGSKAVAVAGTSWGTSWQCSNAVSYTGVVAVQGSPVTASGSGTPAVSATLSTGQMIAAALSRSIPTGGSSMTPSGGTSRYNVNTGGAAYASMAIADSPANLTLSSTGSGVNWGGIALALT